MSHISTPHAYSAPRCIFRQFANILRTGKYYLVLLLIKINCIIVCLRYIFYYTLPFWQIKDDDGDDNDDDEDDVVYVR